VSTLSSDYGVMYLATTSTQAVHTIINANTSEFIPTVAEESDDKPLASIPLPFAFPILGTTTTTLFQNPNGAVHFVPFACQSTGICFPIDTYHRNQLSGWLKDINPGGIEDDIVGYRLLTASSFSTPSLASSAIQLLWHDVPNFDAYDESDPRATFGIELDVSGYMKIEIGEFSSVGSSDSQTIVGLRPRPALINSGDIALFPSQALGFSSTYFSTNLRGVYPMESADSLGVKNSSFELCPLSRDWCYHQINESHLSISFLYHPPCVSSYNLYCGFDSEIVFNESLIEIEEEISPMILDKQISTILPSKSSNITRIHFMASYTCEIPQNQRNTSFNSSFIKLAVDPMINATFLSSSSKISNKEILPTEDYLPFYYQNISSSNNNCISTLETKVNCSSSKNSSCDICSLNVTKLQSSDCHYYDCPSSSFLPFDEVNCQGNCTTQDNVFNNPLDASECCQLDAMDCKFDCGGDLVEAFDSYDQVSLVCCSESSVDCDSQCDGSALYDVCSNCTGGISFNIIFIY